MLDFHRYCARVTIHTVLGFRYILYWGFHTLCTRLFIHTVLACPQMFAFLQHSRAAWRFVCLQPILTSNLKCRGSEIRLDSCPRTNPPASAWCDYYAPRAGVLCYNDTSELRPLSVWSPWYHYLVQFSSRWYLCARKSPCALHPISLKFSQRFLWNRSNVRLIDDGPLSSFQGRYYPIWLLFTQHTFCFSPSSLAGDNRIPIMTMSEPLIGSSWPSVPQEQSGRGELNSTVLVIVLSSLFSDRFCFPMLCYSLIKV